MEDTYGSERAIALRMKLKPGNYVIIPSTYFSGRETEFLLRIFSESTIEAFQLRGKDEDN